MRARHIFAPRVARLCGMALLLGCSLARAGNPQVTELIKAGDFDDAHADTRGALALFQQADKLTPNDPAILLRISKQYLDLISQTKSASEAGKVAQTSLDYAKRAELLDPQNAKAHLCVAIGYGRLTDFTDNRTKLLYSKYTKEETQKSIMLDPTDPFAYHVLGRWNYCISSLNPMLKLMAKYIYGGLPDASMEEAARNLKKATELAPLRIIHHCELARAYKALEKNDLAAKEWETILLLHANDKEDEAAQKEAQIGLKGRQQSQALTASLSEKEKRR